MPKIKATGSDLDNQSQSDKLVQLIDNSTVEVGRRNWPMAMFGFINPAIFEGLIPYEKLVKTKASK